MTAVNALKRLSGKLFIDGDFRDSAATDGFDVINPATEDAVGHILDTTGAEVDEAIAIANKVQKAWNKVNALTRAELMHYASHSPYEYLTASLPTAFVGGLVYLIVTKVVVQPAKRGAY